MGLRVEKGSAVGELYRKACAYDMRSERIDGNDVLAVRDAVREAAHIARTQHQPSLIEAVSYRFRGHSVVDPDRYRDQAEVKAGRDHDPIGAYASRLMDAGILNEEKVREIDAQAQRDVDAAVQFADQSKDPLLDGLFDFIYAPDDTAGREQ